jgi:hypothetical protein
LKILIITCCITLLIITSGCVSENMKQNNGTPVALSKPPVNPGKNEKYLFYLHGIQVELQGPDSWSDHFSKTYAYTDIVNNFKRRGYVVISELRPEGTVPIDYAMKISAQISRLLKAGVPGNNIAVVGHSRGGFMSLLIRRNLNNPDLKIVVLAGCALEGTNSVAGTNPRSGYNWYLENTIDHLHGRMLSIYDSSDEWFGSCQETFDLNKGLEAQEIVLHTGEGHGVFYDPDPAWVNPVINWIGWN